MFLRFEQALGSDRNVPLKDVKAALPYFPLPL